jgi:hypothetical protein
MQTRVDLGEFDYIPAAAGGFWDAERGQPSRALHMSLDNAPYHRGISVQLRSKTKPQIAAILRAKQITRIYFTHKDAVTGEDVMAHAEVPAAGAAWASGWPNAEQVQEGAWRALREVDRQLVQLPFQKLIDQVRELWGPAGKDGLVMLWNAEYVSVQIFIEYIWGIGKNEVGRPNQQFEGRTLAHISDILHKSIIKNDTTVCDNLLRHCEREMDKAMDNGGPLSGTIPLWVRGLPLPEKLKVWKERAGMKEGEEFEPFGEESALATDAEEEDNIDEEAKY